ncbi:hemolysin family protein [Pontimonas sp.]|jgi:CBS domain containing-hemolysin-like protein|uniref:hemolysin family protein n=1 Tax=Pontimonas sp. TaxID=2304492 RepID=UPI00286FD46E|nr:hemolysin family protein [Pontimonas sp.]MDR9396737.1 hemolysin family protein [Pontimonas sp.]MDR9434300.1 hemolysin family protein [Pontimonas sp.]
MSTELILLVTGILLAIGTGVFVGSEFALLNLDRSELEARRERGVKGYGPTIAALKRTSTHLSSAQLGITLTTLLAGYTLEPSISYYLAGPLRGLGLGEDFVRPVGAVLAIVLATGLSMIVGELVPKNYALAVPEATAKVLIPLQLAFTWTFRPFIAVLNGSANKILRAVGVEPKEELSAARTADELSALVRRSALHGLLEQDTATLLSRTLAFAELKAEDVMTPRTRVESVHRSDTAEAIVALAGRTGLSRFPVIDESIDEVRGVVHIKAAMAVPRERRGDVPASALQSEVVRVPETMPLDALLTELRGRGYQLAIVLDEYGGTSGVATLEDLVEELIGEVSDEHDRRPLDVVRARDWFTFPGRWRPDELEDQTGVALPEEGHFETVAGFVIEQLGRLAEVGDTVTIDSGTIRVERLDGRRVERLRFTPDIKPEEVELL